MKKFLTTLLIAWILYTSPLQAEIVLDGTLESLPGPGYLINHERGQLSGTNLFHSFESFNINTGESATFTGPASVTHVINRVTGSDHSWIDGKLHSEIPSADFYFLNPNGIMFGKNAELNIQGSFYASTADYLRLENGRNFYVNQTNDLSLLVTPPSSFGFLNSTPKSITMRGSKLTITRGKDLSFIGGDLTIENSYLSTVGGGQLNLVSIASAGEVIPRVLNTDKKLGNINMIGDSRISGDTKINTKYKGGDIFIEAGNIIMKFEGNCGKSCPGISSDAFGEGNSGNIDIHVSNELKITGKQGISTASTDQATGDAGNINLTVGQLNLQESGYINSSTSTSGKGGKINITAIKGISLSGGSKIASTLNESSSAKEGGDIDINTPRLDIKGSDIQTGASFFTTGNAGNIIINSDYIGLRDAATVISSNMGDSGKGGDIDIFGIDIELLNQSSLMSFGDVDGGDIDLKIRDRLYLHESGIIASAIENSAFPYYLYKNGAMTLDEFLSRLKSTDGIKLGNGGNININKPQFFVLNKSQILATAKSGQGGYINIEADQFIHSFPYEEGGQFQFQSELPYILDLIFDFEEVHFDISRISAASAFGNSGQILINASEKELSKDLLQLSEEYQVPRLLLDRCAGLTREYLSKFFITTRDVSPPTPTDFRM